MVTPETLIALTADETAQRVTYSPIALAVTVAAAVGVSVLLDRLNKKKKEKMRRFIDEVSDTEESSDEAGGEDADTK